MKQYKTISPLIAIQLSRQDQGRPGVLASLPGNVTVEVGGRSTVGPGLVEVWWESETYAVFERDLQTRAKPLGAAAN